MSELKTLKDLNFTYCENPRGIREVLRQEAIKWIKAFRAEYEQGGELMDKFYSDQYCCPQAINNFLRYFFNITEEELI